MGTGMMGGLGGPWGLAASTGLGMLGNMWGGNSTSPLMRSGMNLMNNGAGDIGQSYDQYGQYLGMVNPYIGPAFQQGQQALQNYGQTLTDYSDPAKYMNAARQTQLGAQGIGSAVPSNIAWNDVNYANGANSGLFNASSSQTPSTLAGSQAYGTGVMNQQQAQTLANIGTQAMNAPLQFGQQAAQLYGGNAQNLLGEGQQLNGQMGQLGSDMFNMGQGEYNTGLGATEAYGQRKGAMLNGLTSGIGSMYGFPAAMKMLQQQKIGDPGIGGGHLPGSDYWNQLGGAVGMMPGMDPSTAMMMQYMMQGS